MALRFVEPRFVAAPERPPLQWPTPSITDRTTGAYNRWPLGERCKQPPTRASGGSGDPSPQTMLRPYERSEILVKLECEAHL